MNYYASPSEDLFRKSGPFYHLYTKPLETEIYFRQEQEKGIALNYAAIAAGKSGAVLISYAVMSNHFHFILIGTEAQILEFFKLFKEMMSSYFRFHGRPGIMNGVEPGLTAIGSLKQLRTEIAYVIRNPFVVRTDVNVLADPWSSGYLYFNPLLEKHGEPVSSFNSRELRNFTKSRTITDVPPEIHARNGYACPWSFVDYELVMKLYDNARQFVDSVMKNVEAQVETAIRYGELPSLSDDEMFPVLFRVTREKFGPTAKPRNLDVGKKKQLALILKNDFRSSNGQISRLTGLPLNEVNAMFPLAVKQK